MLHCASVLPTASDFNFNKIIFVVFPLEQFSHSMQYSKTSDILNISCRTDISKQEKNEHSEKWRYVIGLYYNPSVPLTADDKFSAVQKSKES